MYEACFNNKFTDALVLYIFLFLLILVSPFLFFLELINAVRSCFRRTENMSGKVVLITGASSGLGELMTYEYAKRRARLVIVAIREPESRLEQVAGTARELGSPDVRFVFGDVSKIDECRMFVDDTIKHFGRCGNRSTLFDQDGSHQIRTCYVSGYEHMISNELTYHYCTDQDINFWGSVYPTFFAMPHLRKTNGKIVVNTSCAGVLHPPKGGFYNASKAALISFFESLRFEVSPDVTITILTLGFIQTNFITAKYSTNGVGVRLREDFTSVFPTMGAEPCAKAVVDGICKGATSITEPRFFKALFLTKFLFPELLRFFFHSYFPSKSERLET